MCQELCNDIFLDNRLIIKPLVFVEIPITWLYLYISRDIESDCQNFWSKESLLGLSKHITPIQVSLKHGAMNPVARR